MKLVIRGVEGGTHSNLRTYIPQDPNVFDDFVQVHIGEKARKGADAFTIRVATPAGLAACHDAKNGILAQPPLLVIRRFDFDALWNWLEKTVASCQADSWPESVERLKRYFHWEFESSQKR